ncbi:MAG: carboxypeptidase-like regulatory domain-containing protein [Sporocytophaga sp.]|nr:carboxypeptidase-like regulatory domain-containing protein [Sporocytophaga sp.]
MGTRLLFFFLLAPFFLMAQNNDLCVISGQIKSETGEPVEGILVSLKGTASGVYTDAKGNYKIEGIASGTYTLVVYGMGYVVKEKEITLKPGENSVVNLQVKSEAQQMEIVEVYGRSQTKEIQQQAYNVVAVDAKKLHNTTLDLGQALDRVSGVRVRESGGLGSRMSFTLNGFTGRQVRFFMDGIPMENFGSSFQLNSIPVNFAERIEIYKGVVPIWLGSDAMGGAVNIVTSALPGSYLDASYTYGSFNTHRSAVNAGYTSKKGLNVQVSLFQNYSDNNYLIYAPVIDIKTSALTATKWVRRFHDKYHNEAVVVNVGVVNKKYADKLLFGFTYGQNYADIQTDARMAVPYGTPYQKGNTIMPTFRYAKKDLFLKGLDVTVSANYNLGYNQVIDTVNRRYNWLGQYNNDFEKNGIKGGERNRTLYKFRNNSGIAVAVANYRLSARHTITLSNTYNTFNRLGSDELVPENASYEQPRYNTKNIIGLGYKFDLNEKWNTTLFGKYYSQVTKYSESYTVITEQFYREKKKLMNPLGYGIATTYFPHRSLQLKASFEKTYRLPEPDELFGDQVDLEGNVGLRAESSFNYNLGLGYNFQIRKNHRISFEATGIYRDAQDFIRQVLAINQVRYTMENRGKVLIKAVEGEIRYSYKKVFSAGFNTTYQDMRNYTKYEPGQQVVSDVYKYQLPNFPYLFSNADASLFFHGLGKKKGNTLSLGYNFLYVHGFYLYWPKIGGKDDKLDIPLQFNHDINIVYSMADGKYNISFTCRNILNNEQYDNFKLQKPGRAFYIKLRYFIRKNADK